MLNDDHDDDETPADIDPGLDADFAEIDADHDDAEAPEAPAKPRDVAPKKKPAARRKAAKAAPKAKAAKARATPAVKPAPAKKAAKKAAKAAKKKAAKTAARSTPPPSDLTAVKAGAHTLWVSTELAAVLTSKDQRKLKALLKRAEKRRKSKKS